MDNPQKWAALFPGQGSQSVGMGRFLFDEFPIARQTFEEASDALKLDFKKLCFDGPESDLQLTENTQPALLLVSTATFRVINTILGVEITAGAGHSVGEYAAVVAAGSVSFSDAMRAVRARGQAMQKAVPVGQGGMVAVLGLSDNQVLKLCQWTEETSGLKPIEPANFNAPGQVVISGSQKAIEWLRANAKAEIFAPETPRMKLIPLAVSAPFHCSLMKPAEEEMALVLGATKFSKAAWPVVQNVTARETTDAETLRSNLVKQISGAVRWTQCVSRLKELGVTRSIEFGAGKVLSGLAKKIDSNGEPPLNINGLEDIKALESSLARTTH
ncbi:MAG: ACP S-malonyltransferase [Bdellovibrionota bacterium]